MTPDEEKVFSIICDCEIGTYMATYAPGRGVVSTREIADMGGYSKYRVSKLIKALVLMGIVERASVGCPALVSYGEYTELICEARPPKNGYAITKAAFESDVWKRKYNEWCKSLAEWANG